MINRPPLIECSLNEGKALTNVIFKKRNFKLIKVKCVYTLCNGLNCFNLILLRNLSSDVSRPATLLSIL